MREKILTYASAGFSSCGIVLSAQDIESYLNIILITISVLILCINFGLRIYDRIKDGKLTKQEIKETIDDLQDAKNKIDGMKGGK